VYLMPSAQQLATDRSARLDLATASPACQDKFHQGDPSLPLEQGRCALGKVRPHSRGFATPVSLKADPTGLHLWQTSHAANESCTTTGQIPPSLGTPRAGDVFQEVSRIDSTVYGVGHARSKLARRCDVFRGQDGAEVLNQ
jgi:hypothetical protein